MKALAYSIWRASQLFENS